MVFDKTSLEYEKGRLELVLAKVREQLEKCRNSAEGMKRETIEMQKSMWEHVDPTSQDVNDRAEVWRFETDLVREGRKAIFAASRVGKLEKMLDNPYFGRLDFQEDEQPEAEEIYIGLSNLSDEKTGEYYIYDWRAPVSGMFYDYETGRASYDCPAGRIEGNVVLKRQYRIWRGNIEFMFDCSLAIDDEILQELLSRSADSRMKTIVTSIQREQNRVIRNDSHKLLVVHGPAGSGKTSIALHRAAFLLYRYKENITAENIVVFSPNSIFSDYVSEVLPELGEENIQRTTFMEYALKILGGRLAVETPYDMMEYMLAGKGMKGYASRIKGMKYKSSQSFMKLLERYTQFIEENWSFEDICHNDVCIETKGEIDDYFRNGLRFLPVSKRLEKIRNRLTGKLDPMIRDRTEVLIKELTGTGEYLDRAEIRGRSAFIAREEFKPVKDRIESMTRLDATDCYAKLFSDLELHKRLQGELPEDIEMIAGLTSAKLSGREIFNEDVAPLLYLAGLLCGIPAMDGIRHVIIDEVQDYSIIQLELIHRLFRDSSLTLLGDPCQSINPFLSNVDAKGITDVFSDLNSIVIGLSKSYRSTRRITAFCRRILGISEGEYVERDGAEPEIIRRDEASELYECIMNDIAAFSGDGCRSIAVICRTAQASRMAHERLSKTLKLRLVTAKDDEYVKGISVIPSYLSKGLEFDAVLVLCLNGEDYAAEEERKLLYTVCTRALHRLNIYCLGQAVPEPFMY